MCGRYFLPEEEAFAWQDMTLSMAEPGIAAACKTHGEVFPGDCVPVLAVSRALHPKLFAMHWGYRMPNKRLVFNARSETAAQLPLFGEGMRQRRCLIPFSHYSEWQRNGVPKPVRYEIVPETGSSTHWLAAIYRMEGQTPFFTVLTRDASDSVRSIHHRMPVILPTDVHRDWLNPQCGASAVQDMLQYALLQMRCTSEKAQMPLSIPEFH